MLIYVSQNLKWAIGVKKKTLLALFCIVCQYVISTGTISNTSIQTRSQDLEKGGLFWKTEKCANDLDPIFHCSWISFTRFVRKLRRNFSEKLGNSKVFSAQNQVVSKKKKKIFTEFETDFSARIVNPNVWGEGCFPMGWLFSIFHKKTASKPRKKCDFAYFTSQWGGSSPPPPLPWLRYCQYISTSVSYCKITNNSRAHQNERWRIVIKVW